MLRKSDLFCRHFWSLFTFATIILLLLPNVVSAHLSTFPIRVVHEGEPVYGAQVVVWDINSFDKRSNATTDVDGMVELSLYDVSRNPSSTTNPEPNIGIFVVPPFDTELAHNVHKIRFFNVFDGDAVAKETEIELEKGSKVVFDLKYDDNPYEPDTEIIDGIKTSSRLIVAGVPTRVSDVSYFYNADKIAQLIEKGEEVAVYWPAGKSGTLQIDEDLEIYNKNSDKYYAAHGQTFFANAVGEELLVEVLHNSSPKGSVSVNLPEDISDGITRYLNGYSYAENKQVYFPVGTYDFEFKIDYFDLEGFSPPPAVWARQKLEAGDHLEFDYDLEDGTGLYVSLFLGSEEEPGNFVALANPQSYVYISQLTVNEWGYESWVSRPGEYARNDGYPTQIKTRLAPGKYRISINRAPNTSWAQGVIDNSSNVPKCYYYVTGETFEVGSGSNLATQSLVLPLAPAFYAEFIANHSDYNDYVGYEFSNLRVGYMPTSNQENGYELRTGIDYSLQHSTFGTQTQGHVFVPFAAQGRLVVRLDLENYWPQDYPSYFEVFAPVTIGDTPVTKSEPYQIDEEDFTTYSGKVKFQENDFIGKANLLISPIIPGTDIPGHRVFNYGQSDLSDRGFDNQTLTQTSAFSFGIKKGTDHELYIIEHQSWPRSLQGVKTKREIINVDEETIKDFIIDSDAGFFEAKITLEGEPIKDVVEDVDEVFVSLVSLTNPDYVRSGLVNPSGFIVSGVEAGNYKLMVDIDNVKSYMAKHPNYSYYQVLPDAYWNYQANPVLSRDVLVDGVQANTEPITIDLQPSKIGFLQASIFSNLQVAISNVRIAVVPGVFSEEELWAPWSDGIYAQAAFFCITDENGNLSYPATNEYPNLIPLEEGRYNIFAYGIVDEGIENYYNLGRSHYPTYLKSFDIEAGLITELEPIVAERKLDLYASVFEDGELCTEMLDAYRLSDSHGSYLWYDYSKERSYGYFKDGTYLIIYNRLWENWRMSKEANQHLHFAVVDMNLGPDKYKLELDEIRFDSSSLKEVTINTLADGKSFALNGTVKLFDPQGNLFWPVASDPHFDEEDSVFCSNSDGKIVIRIPDLSAFEELEGFYFVYFPEESDYISDDDEMQFKKFFPVDSEVIIGESNEITANWTEGKRVTFEVTDGKANANYFAFLVEEENFHARNEFYREREDFHEPHFQEPHFEEYEPLEVPPGPGFLTPNARYARFLDGKFVFQNLEPGKNYVFVAYEAADYISTDDISSMILPSYLVWGEYDFPLYDGREGKFRPFTFYNFDTPAYFRYYHNPVTIIEDAEFEVGFPELANFTFKSEPEMLLEHENSMVSVSFAPNSQKTTGETLWPAIINGDAFESVVALPADRAYKLELLPGEKNDRFATGLVDEDVLLPLKGRTHTFKPPLLNKVTGIATLDGSNITSSYAEIWFAQSQSLAFSADFAKHSLDTEGAFETYLRTGDYVAFLLAPDSAVNMFKFKVERGVDIEDLQFEADSGVEVSGTIVDEDNEPLAYLPIQVLRKLSDRSELADGGTLSPYFTDSEANSVIYSNYRGEVKFLAQKNVDYYIQPIARHGMKPVAPIKVSVDEVAPEAFEVKMYVGGEIVGKLAQEAVGSIVEVWPIAYNSAQHDYSDSPAYMAVAKLDGQAQMADFALLGLDKDMLYNVLVFPPSDSNLAVKKLTNVEVGSDLDIELEEAIIVYGQLVDQDNQPLEVAGVELELELLCSLDSVDSNLLTTVSLYTTTDASGNYSFTNVPAGFVSAFIKSHSPFQLNKADYALAVTGPFESVESLTRLEKDLPVKKSGSLIGKLINESGQPISIAEVEIQNLEKTIELTTNVGPNGQFELKGLPPASDYSLCIQNVPQKGEKHITDLKIHSATVTDIGNIMLSDAITVTGKVADVDSLLARVYPKGKTENAEFAVLSFDANYKVTDEELLTEGFLNKLFGVADLIWDSSTNTTEIPFNILTNSGRQSFALLLARGANSLGNAENLVFWGWQPNVAIPTIEQLKGDSFKLSDELLSETDFGSVFGTMTHSIAKDALFNQTNSLIAFYQLDENGKEIQSALPTALVRLNNGKYFLKDLPAGDYRVKAITRRFGSQTLKNILTVKADEEQSYNIAIGGTTNTVKLSGHVYDTETDMPIEDASVKMVLRNAVALTNADGYFEFEVPYNEFVIPQFEFSRTGYKTLRLSKFDKIASAGKRLIEALDLDKIELSPATGRTEVKVVDEKTGAAIVGAEVAMVLKHEAEGSLDVYTVADRKITDHTGLVTFTSVPVYVEVTYRADAHYYKPSTINATGAVFVEETILMAPRPPKAFYTGFPTRVDEDDTVLSLDATFDFVPPITKDELLLKTLIRKEGEDEDIEELDSDSLTYPDLIGNKITVVKYNGKIRNIDNLHAVVDYESEEIADFEIVKKAIFRKEYEVNPLAKGGFSANAIDEKGNQLPIGLSVPEGYLSPEIDSFELQINEMPDDVEADMEDGTTAKHAGPTFEFTFNRGAHHAAGTQQKGLFEITIAYEPGATSLEPRWKDDNGNWSKVGIIKELVQWDVPSVGYVTFTVDHLTEFGVFSGVEGAESGLRGDLTGDGKVGLEDIAVYLAYYMSGSQDDLYKLTQKALELYKGDYEAKYLPSSADDFNADGSCNLSDVAVMLAWYMTGKNPDTEVLTSKAKDLFTAFKGSVHEVPATAVNR